MPKTLDLNNLINQSQFKKYASALADQGLSNSTIRRKLSALTTFHKFLAKKKLVSPPNSFARYNFQRDEAISRSINPPLIANPDDTTNSSFTTSPTPPNRLKTFFFNRYFVFASALILLSSLGYTLYTQVFNRANKNLAYSSASSLIAPNRILSFQGRLTDSSGNPITSSTGITFKLFTLGSGGTELYNSGAGNSQTVIPDENGIFSVVIGKSHGLGIASSVFSENAEVWLEITAGGETMNPRQQIATVGYALNSETLQGLPPSASGIRNTVLVIDGSGNLNLGETSPSIYSQSGTLGIIGQAILIGSSDGSGGNITINPDGAGKLKFITEGTGSTATGGLIEATNANMASGNLYSAYINNDNRGYNFLDFSNYNVGTTTLSSRFSVNAFGNLTSAGTINTSIGITTPRITISIGATSGYILQTDAFGNASWVNPGSSGIGTSYDAGNGLTKVGNLFKFGGPLTENTRLNIGNTEILYVDYATGRIGIGTTNPTQTLDLNGNVMLSSTNPVIYLSDANNWIQKSGSNLITKSSGSMYFRDTANTDRLSITTTYSSLYGPSSAGGIYINSSGNVGIGTTAPSKKLDIVGDINLTGTIFSNGTSGTSGQVLSSTGTGLQWINSSGVGTTYSVTNGLSAISTNTFGLGGTLTQNTFIGTSSSSIAFGINTTSPTLYLSSSSNVGIGTTAPSKKLDVAGDINLTGTIFSSGISGTSGQILSSTGTGLAWVNSSGIGQTYSADNGLHMTGNVIGLGGTITENTRLHIGNTEVLYLKSSNGYVGIGTTNPLYKLEVNGDALISSRLGIGSTDVLYALHVGNSAVRFDNNLSVGGTTTLVGLSIGTTGAGSTVVFVDASGNLYKNILGAGAFGTGTTSSYTFTNGLTNTAGSVGLGGTLNGNTQIGTSSFNLIIGNNTTSPTLYVSTNNIGIGTSNPTSKLHVLGNIQADASNDNGGFYAYSITPTHIFSFTRQQTGITTDLSISAYGGLGLSGGETSGPKTGNYDFYITNSGNVGIGTTNPTKKLDVVGDINLTGTIFSAGVSGTSGQVLTSTGTGLQWVNAGSIGGTYVFTNGLTNTAGTVGLGGTLTSSTVINTGSNSLSFLGLGNTQSLFIGASGYVGIGTTNPNQKLTVTGNIRATGNLALNNASINSNYGIELGSWGNSSRGINYNGTLTSQNSSLSGIYNTLSTGGIGLTDVAGFDQYVHGLYNDITINSSADPLSQSSLAIGVGVKNNFTLTNGSTSPVAIGTWNAVSDFTDANNMFIGTYNGTTLGSGITTSANNISFYSSSSFFSAYGNNNSLSGEYNTFSSFGNNNQIFGQNNSIDIGGSNSSAYGISNTITSIGDSQPKYITGIYNNINVSGDGSYATGSNNNINVAGDGLPQTTYGENINISISEAIDTAYGLYVNTANGFQNTFAIYTDAGKNAFMGDVGIGTTSPSEKLDVAGNINIGSTASYKINGSSIVNYIGNIIQLNPDSIALATSIVDGKFGVGTTNPTYGIDVVGHAATYGSGQRSNMRLWDNSPSAKNVGGGIVFGGQYSSGNFLDWANVSGVKENGINNDYSGALTFGTIRHGGTFTEKARISSLGFLGIGTSDPQYTLDIAGSGNLNMTGTIFSAGISGSSGQVLSSTGTGLQWITVSAGSTYTASAGVTLVGNDFRLNLGSTNVWLAPQYFGNGVGITGNLTIGGTFVSVGSTNLVTNLNANYLNGLASSSFLQIGQTGSLPYVNDATNTTLTRSGTGPYTLSLNLGSTNIWTAYQTFGNGIGVTGAANIGTSLTVGTNLRVGGSVTFTGIPIGTGSTILYIGVGGSLVQGTLPAGTSYTATNGLNLSGSAFGLGGTLTSNTFIGTSSFSLSLGINTTSPTIHLTSSGNVGIGTSNPSQKLSVKGNPNFYNSTDPMTTLLTTDDGNFTGLVSTWKTTQQYGSIQTWNGNVTASTKLILQPGGGSIGIGTTNPSGIFQVGIADAGGSGPVFMIKTTGEIGIGTTDPTKKIDVNGDIKINGTLFVGSAGVTGTSGQYLASNGAGSLQWVTGTGSTYTFTNGLTNTTGIVRIGGTLTQNTQIGTSDFDLSFIGHGGTQSLFIGSSGFVGVGTTSQTNNFEVADFDTAILRVKNSGSNSYIDLSSGAGSPSLSLYQSGTLIGNIGTNYAGTDIALWGRAGRTLTFGTNNSQVANFDLAGNFGINSATPIARLQVIGTGSSHIAIFDGTGNVGIGTTNPSKKLDVAGDINLTGTIFATGTSGTSGQILSSTGTGLQWINSSVGSTYTFNNGLTNTAGIVRIGGTLTQNTQIGTSDFDLSFIGLGGSQSLQISKSGNIGIGTTNPGTQLEISGVTPILRLNNTSTGNTGISQIMSGIELNAGTMNASGRYTSALKFTSTDAQFTTSNPKFLAGIVGRATETYSANTDSGMGMDFLTTIDNGGSSPTPSISMSIDQNGNIGIGTSAPTKKLDITGDINLTGTIFTTGTSGTSGQILSSTGTGLQWINSSVGSTYTFNNGLTNTAGTVGLGGTLASNTIVNIGANSLSFLGLSNSQALFIGTSGYIGVGITNPAYKLHVNGSAIVGDVSSAIQNDSNNNGDSATLFLKANNQSADYGAAVRGIRTGSNGSSSLNFLTTNSSNLLTRMTITSAGLIGIGTTAPSKALDVVGDINLTGTIFATGTSGTSGQVLSSTGTGLQWIAAGVGSTYSFTNGLSNSAGTVGLGGTLTSNTNIGTSSFNLSLGLNTTTPMLYLSANNRVGIGTSAPTNGYKLEIYGNGTDSNLFIHSASSTNSSYLTTGNDSGTQNSVNYTSYGSAVGGSNFGLSNNNKNQILSFNASSFVIGTQGTAPLVFGTNSLERMRINGASGFVGIGTSNPQAQLDIAGATSLISNTSGDITINASTSQVGFSGNSLKNINNVTLTGTMFVGAGVTGASGQVLSSNGAGSLSWITPSGATYTASNGVTMVGTVVGLGGSLTQNTTIGTSSFLLNINGTITAGKFGSYTDPTNYFIDPSNSTVTNASASFHGAGSILFNTFTIGSTQVTITANSSTRLKSFSNGFSIATNIGSTGVGSTINWDDSIFIDTSGDIGIGTTDPIGLFNVATGATQALVIASNGSIGFGTTSPLGVFEVKVNGTGGTSAFNIAANGKVGIGTSIASAYQLQVIGNNTSGVAFIRNLATTGNTMPTLIVQTAGTGLGTTGAEFVRFLSSTGVKVGRIRLATSATTVAYATSGTNDLAEYMLATEPSDAGDLMSFNGTKFSRYTPGSTIGGIHSSYATLVGNEYLADQPNAFPLAISGIVKLKVSTENGPIHPGDPLSGSNIVATASKAIKPGYIVGRALENYTNSDPSQVGTIEVIVGLNWYDPDIMLTDSGEINVNHNISDEVLSSLGYTASKNEIESAQYSLNDSLGRPVTRLAQFAQISSAKIKAGLISTTNLIAKNIVAETTKSKSVQTAVLTPLSDITDTIVVDGNLAVNGTLVADKLESKEATISTLYAENIISKEGNFGQLMTDKIIALREEIRNTISSIGVTESVSTLSALVADVPTWSFNAGTSQTEISGDVSLSDNMIIGAKLTVLGDTQLGNAFITGTFTAGEVAIKDNFIETTASMLHIQPSGLGSVNIMNDTLIIAENGEVTLNGNLAVNGNINATSLFANLINSDEINTKKLTAESINVATSSATPIIAESGFAALATTSAQVSTNATAGTATLPTGKTELVIYNEKITQNSIIYLTPVGSTNNQVVYLKSKHISPTPTPESTSSATVTSSFVIALDSPLLNNIDINWWIIN